MRSAGAVIAVLVLIAAGFAYLHAPAASSRRASDSTGSSAGNDPRVAQLSRQVEELQRSLGAMQAQLAAQKNTPAAQPAKPTENSPATELDVEAQRAQEAEQRRQYMAEVAAAFNNEKVDAPWAGRVSSRITSSFEGDDRLRRSLRTVECRSQTCRVQIDEDDSNEISRRMPVVSLALADVLPTLSAEHVDQGNGHRTMILYMSSQRPAPTGPRR
jgi:hypothetical protein